MSTPASGHTVDFSHLPPKVRKVAEKRLKLGLPVRTDPNEALAGRCGGQKSEFSPGSKLCERPAGWGTDHVGWDRCRDHEGVEEGLAPWYGPKLHLRRVRSGGERHGATTLAVAPLEEIFSKYLEPEEIAVMRSAIHDPMTAISVVMGLRTTALLRIQRYLQAQRVRSKGVVTQEILAVESVADRAAQTIARLAEVRKGYMELEAMKDRDRAMTELLAGLSDDDFARIKSDPRAMAMLIGGGQ